MGFELEAFIAKKSDLQTWMAQLPAVVVCDLTGELGLVPVTDKLFVELRARLDHADADQLDAAERYRSYPSPSQRRAVAAWAAHASAAAATVICYVSASEFGDDSSEVATVWDHGLET